MVRSETTTVVNIRLWSSGRLFRVIFKEPAAPKIMVPVYPRTWLHPEDLNLKFMVLDFNMLQFQVVKRQDHSCHNIFSRLFLNVRFCTHLCIAASLLWYFIMAYTLNLFLSGDIKISFCHLKLLCY
jgi:hypothetical protein